MQDEKDLLIAELTAQLEEARMAIMMYLEQSETRTLEKRIKQLDAHIVNIENEHLTANKTVTKKNTHNLDVLAMVCDQIESESYCPEVCARILRTILFNLEA